MKVKTIEQFKILQYIEEYFNVENVTLELIDRYTIKVTDKDKQYLKFKYMDNKIVWERSYCNEIE